MTYRTSIMHTTLTLIEIIPVCSGEVGAVVSTKWMEQVEPTAPVSLALVYRRREGFPGHPLSSLSFQSGTV